jgi:hypothetical protein
MVTETVGDPKALEAMGFLKVIKPELVVPMVTSLASGDGDLTHQNFSACGGRFARDYFCRSLNVLRYACVSGISPHFRAPSVPAVGGRLPTGDGQPFHDLEPDHRGDDHGRRLNRRLGQDVSSKPTAQQPRIITSAN